MGLSATVGIDVVIVGTDVVSEKSKGGKQGVNWDNMKGQRCSEFDM